MTSHAMRALYARRIRPCPGAPAGGTFAPPPEIKMSSIFCLYLQNMSKYSYLN